MRACCALVRSTLAAALAAALTADAALAILGLAAATTRAATLATALDTLGLAAAAALATLGLAAATTRAATLATALATLGLAAAATLDAGLAAGLTDRGGRTGTRGRHMQLRQNVGAKRDTACRGYCCYCSEHFETIQSSGDRSAHSGHSLASSTRRAVGRKLRLNSGTVTVPDRDLDFIAGPTGSTRTPARHRAQT